MMRGKSTRQHRLSVHSELHHFAISPRAQDITDGLHSICMPSLVCLSSDVMMNGITTASDKLSKGNPQKPARVNHKHLKSVKTRPRFCRKILLRTCACKFSWLVITHQRYVQSQTRTRPKTGLAILKAFIKKTVAQLQPPVPLIHVQ